MNVLLITIPIAMIMAAGFVILFFWIARTGQYEDLDTPAHRILDRKEKP